MISIGVDISIYRPYRIPVKVLFTCIVLYKSSSVPMVPRLFVKLGSF